MKELICPICRSAFIKNATGLICENGHSFDRSRYGYFNLLPVQHKKSKQPGESIEQLQARREFLSAGYFSPLANKILDSLPTSINHFVDLGCGEGYFSSALSHKYSGANAYAVDISKVAAKLTAKTNHSNLTVLVASNYQLPFAEGSLDLVTRILAPSFDAEVFRVLNPNGIFMVVRPNDEHLVELRKRCYTELRPYQAPRIPEGFILEKESVVNFELELPDQVQAQRLLQMTPFAWRLSKEAIESLSKDGWRDKADFRISLYRKAETI